MWMTILKSAKGHFIELEKMLRGVDRKYLRGDVYFPREETPSFYEELWTIIRKQLRLTFSQSQWGQLNPPSVIKETFRVLPEDRKGHAKKYTVRLNMKSLITPTPKQAASWKGIMLKPEAVKSNWKSPEAMEEGKKRKRELDELTATYTEPYLAPTFSRRMKEKTRVMPQHVEFVAQQKKQYEEWVKENMIPESERVDEFSTHGRISNKPPSTWDMSTVSSSVDKGAWEKAHTGHFILMVYNEKGNKILNIQIRLNVGFKPPPRNPWSFPSTSDMSLAELQKYKKSQKDWNLYWKEYVGHQKSDEYKEQTKIQKALLKVFDILSEPKPEIDIADLGDLFG
jgi:hypothetical protein